MPQLLKPARLEPVLRNKRSHRSEKTTHHNEDPTQPKINKLINFLKNVMLLASELRLLWVPRWGLHLTDCPTAESLLTPITDMCP